MRWLTTHARAHLLVFDSRERNGYSTTAGVRLLAVFLILEGLAGPRRAPPPVMLGAALLMIRYLAGVRFSQIGIDGWRRWTASEKAYVVHIVPLAIVIFAFVTGARLKALAADPALWAPGTMLLARYAVWGFYQELLYRGVLQTELVRRFGAVIGVLVATAAYTFGPLHLYYFATYQPPALYAMLAAVFAIGLYFALVFHRSGNLVIVGMLHAIGDMFLTALPQLR
jgi:CAAX protease family protein